MQKWRERGDDCVVLYRAHFMQRLTKRKRLFYLNTQALRPLLKSYSSIAKNRPLKDHPHSLSAASQAQLNYCLLSDCFNWTRLQYQRIVNCRKTTSLNKKGFNDLHSARKVNLKAKHIAYVRRIQIIIIIKMARKSLNLKLHNGM